MPMMGCLGLLPLSGVVFVVSGSSLALMVPRFWRFSGRLFWFNHSCLGRVGAGDWSWCIGVWVGSLVVQTYFNFGDSSFVVHFALGRTGLLFLGGSPDTCSL